MATYYVKNSGLDSNSGLSDALAWKTLAKVNATSLSAGDFILFNKGDIWREILIIPTSGNSSNYITFTSYGTGNKPKIIGSVQALSWTNLGGNLWRSGTSLTDPYSAGSYGAEVFFENTNGTVSWGVHQSGTGSLTAEYDWTCSSGNIYVYSPSDPTTRYTSVEAPQRPNSVNLNDKNYLHFDGIDVFYVTDAGFTYETYPMQSQTGLIIENSEIGYVSVKDSELGYGIDATYSNQIVRHCNIHDCGRRSISHHLYGSYTATNILIEDNYFHDGWHTTGPDFSVGSSTLYSGIIDGVIIRRNTFYDPPASQGYSEQIFLQNYLYSTLQAQLKNVYIYSNIFISPTANSINAEGTQSVYIYNNAFYNHRPSGAGAHVWIDNNNASVKVKNNIFYTTSTNDQGGEELFIRAGQNLANVDANYNLYYRINNNLRIVEKESFGIFYMNDIALIRSKLGLEMNSPTPANPLFTSSTDYHLQAGSPAINAGLAISEVTTDFEGKTFNNPPSIGAYEYSTISGVGIAIDSTDVSTTDVDDAILSSSHVVSDLVGAIELNKYSYYAPGTLGTDANKDVTLIPPSTSFKLGDYRSYNPNSPEPTPQFYYIQGWGPGGATTSFNQAWFPQDFNIEAVTGYNTYVTTNYYMSTADRAVEGNRIKQVVTAITLTANTPLAGHTRQSAFKASATQILNITDFPVLGLSTPDDYVYCDTFISTLTGVRVINLGTKDNGYTTILFREYVNPYAYGSNTNIPAPPTGYTVIFPSVYNASTPVCSSTSQVIQTEGLTTYDFYVFAKGIYSIETRIVALTSVDIILTLDSVRTTMASGVALSQASGYHCTGTLAGGATWSYGDHAMITFENGVIASTPAYTTC